MGCTSPRYGSCAAPVKWAWRNRLRRGNRTRHGPRAVSSRAQPKQVCAKGMEITVTVPDDLVAPLLLPGPEPTRAALEAIGLEAYRRRRITGYQLRVLLGIGTRYELDGFLKQHEIYDYTIDDFGRDLATIRERDQDPER